MSGNETAGDIKHPYIILTGGPDARTLVPLREIKFVREESGRVTIHLVSGGSVGVNGGQSDEVLDLVADLLTREASS